MNDKELRSRLNAELSNISWSARNSSAVRQRVNNGGTVMKKKMSFAFVLAMILVMACIATAVAAAVSEDFNTWLYQLWPEAALKLMPVELSNENNGIRMEVLSATAEGSEVLITFTLEDLEGDRLFDGVTSIYRRVSYGDTTVASREGGAEYYNEEDHKLYSAEYAQYANRTKSEDDCLKLEVELFDRKEMHKVELFQYLQERGGEVRMTGVPEGAVVRRPYLEPDNRTFSESGLPETMQVIDSASSLEIPLFESVYLSGVKIVDGWAHIQLHFRENGYLPSEKGGYRQYDSTLDLYNAEDEDLSYADDALYNDCRVLYWGWEGRSSYDFGLAEWVEYIFPVDAAAVETAASLPVQIEKGISPVNANLGVWIPVRLIKNAR